ncbi:zinc finger protein 525-like [Copidosoma floridanum]|uniref:zinc finger protein 525-like n=1 Tax=Copidosoma floridanum TaxID=29053 RepID=UPI0006C99D2D|nr:zinc finger protein 525-like [Copidosoma floridanum]
MKSSTGGRRLRLCIYKCKYCANSYDCQNELDAHLETLHAHERLCICQLCNECFTTESDLSLHYHKHFDECRYKCDNCESAFARKSLIIKHIRANHGIDSNRCETCGKFFSTKSSLDSHKVIHTGLLNIYKCDKCDKSYYKKRSLARHACKVINDAQHQCEFCNKSFSAKKSLTRHLQRHAATRRYTCDYCGKSFVDKSDHRRHIRIHTGERPHKCNYCYKTFIRKHHLRMHQLIHTKRETQSSYMCSNCGSVFEFLYSLDMHKCPLSINKDEITEESTVKENVAVVDVIGNEVVAEGDTGKQLVTVEIITEEKFMNDVLFLQQPTTIDETYVHIIEGIPISDECTKKLTQCNIRLNNVCIHPRS